MILTCVFMSMCTTFVWVPRMGLEMPRFNVSIDGLRSQVGWNVERGREPVYGSYYSVRITVDQRPPWGLCVGPLTAV